MFDKPSKLNGFISLRLFFMASLKCFFKIDSIDSFIQDDAQLAKKVIGMDSTLDKFNKENHQILINVMKENPDNIEPAVVMLVTSRQIERLGDHSTNIAEDVYFIVEARMVKHKYEKYLFSQDTDDDDEEDLKKQV